MREGDLWCERCRWLFAGEPTFPGCRDRARSVSVFVMRDEKGWTMNRGPTAVEVLLEATRMEEVN